MLAGLAFAIGLLVGLLWLYLRFAHRAYNFGSYCGQPVGGLFGMCGFAAYAVGLGIWILRSRKMREWMSERGAGMFPDYYKGDGVRSITIGVFVAFITVISLYGTASSPCYIGPH